MGGGRKRIEERHLWEIFGVERGRRVRIYLIKEGGEILGFGIDNIWEYIWFCYLK